MVGLNLYRSSNMAKDKNKRKITIDDVEYILDDLSDNVKAQLTNI